jgi:hypothetical protein
MRAAQEARYLIDRGYPTGSAVRYISDHHRLPDEHRFVLGRTIVAKEVARRRMAKVVGLPALRGKTVFVDGYNVLITTESLLANCSVYLCDDGFLRDTRGLFAGYRPSPATANALFEILDILARAKPARAEVLLDQQISRSGELAAQMREIMGELGLPGEARTARDVDHQLKVCGAAVASSDGNVIDSASLMVDIPAEIAAKRLVALRRI